MKLQEVMQSYITIVGAIIVSIWAVVVGGIIIVYDTCTYVVQGDFLTGSLPLFSDKMKKGPRIQPEAFLYEGFHGRGALVGFVAFF